LFGGILVTRVFGGEAIYAIVIAGVFMLISAVAVIFVRDEDRPYSLMFPWSKRDSL
jgi:maltose/moltooligosaccharide transporter